VDKPSRVLTMNAIKERIPFRLTRISLIGLLIAVAGCGTITVDIHTQIISQQEISQQIEYIIAGPIAQLMITDGEIDLSDGASLGDLEALDAVGWDFQIDVIQVDGDDAVRMRLSQTFTGEDAAEQFRLASEALAEQDSSTSMVPLLEITETEDEIVYDLRMDISVDDAAIGGNGIPSGGDPASGVTASTPEPLIINGTVFPDLPAFQDPDATGDISDFGAFADGLEASMGDGMQDFADALAASFEDFITIKWSVEMPGEVGETNATTNQDGLLTWELKFSDIAEGNSELFANSTVSKDTGGSCNR